MEKSGTPGGRKHDYYVVELSSFQLDGMTEFKADIAIPQCHTRSFGPLQVQFSKLYRLEISYYRIKRQKMHYLLERRPRRPGKELREKETFSQHYNHCSAARKNKSFIENEQLIINTLNNIFTMPATGLSTQGMHNTYNSMAAGLTASIVNIRKESIHQSVAGISGRGAPTGVCSHCEKCKIYQRLQSHQRKFVLVCPSEYENAGNSDPWRNRQKGNDYTEIEELVIEKVSGLIFWELITPNFMILMES